MWPEPSGSDSSGISGALPPDLLDQVRGRVRLLALLLFVAFMVDPLAYLLNRLILTWRHQPILPAETFQGALQPVYLGVAAASAGLWWIARQPRVAPDRLHTLGLWYQVLVCFVIALTSNLEYFTAHGLVPELNWVPTIVVLFPLVLPGPPRRMLIAAISSAAMSPLSQLLLESTGLIRSNLDSYFSATVHSAFAVACAYMGARVVYGLGREVVKARELGSYRLGELLGAGGMGEVYRATHRMLARPAAIKLIRPEMLKADPAGPQVAITRFRREAEAAASLRSPHTVELYDFGVTPDNTFYCVMELLDGSDLESLVRQKGPMSPSRVIYLLRQVCESLEEAHAKGLVHRDIKPANIHLGRLGMRHDFVKVLDFGLVKSIDKEPREDSMATAQGNVAGTPSYMAPEVAMGEPFDGKADIYAVGCVGFFLLTGRQLFEAATPMALIVRHMRDTPEPPSSRSELPIPAALDQLILRCLAKSPAQRPTAVELSSGLASVPAGPWGEEQAKQWWTTNRPG